MPIFTKGYRSPTGDMGGVPLVPNAAILFYKAGSWRIRMWNSGRVRHLEQDFRKKPAYSFPIFVFLLYLCVAEFVLAGCSPQAIGLH